MEVPRPGTFNALVLVPLILPPFVGALGIRQFLGQAGVLNAFLIDLGLMDASAPFDWLGEGRLAGIVLMNALHLYPIAYLNLTAALANLDPALEEAAENLGCHGIRRFFRVTLPLIMPGLFAGGTIIFIWAFTELGVPLVFDFERVTSVQIFEGIKDLSGNPFPYASSSSCSSRPPCSISPENGSSDGTVSPDGTGLDGPAFAARSAGRRGIGGGALRRGHRRRVLPHLGVILLSLSNDWYGTVLPVSLTGQHYTDALGHPLTLSSIGNSLKYAALATSLDLVLGIGVAYVVVRTRLPGRELLDAMAMLPLAVPGLVLAFGYLAMTREGQAFEGLVWNEDPIWILVIAYAVRRLPYVVRSAAAGFQQTSVSLEEAAQNLGCPPLKALRRVTLPLISANLIAGCLLAFPLPCWRSRTRSSSPNNNSITRSQKPSTRSSPPSGRDRISPRLSESGRCSSRRHHRGSGNRPREKTRCPLPGLIRESGPKIPSNFRLPIRTFCSKLPPRS